MVAYRNSRGNGALDFKTTGTDFSPKSSNLTPLFSIKLSVTQADVRLSWDGFSVAEWMMHVGAGGTALVPLYSRVHEDDFGSGEANT